MISTGETEWHHSKWGRVAFENSTVVVTACSACDFQVRKFQPIKLWTICIYKQRLGRHLIMVFLIFWGISRVWKRAVIRIFRSNLHPPLGLISCKFCITRLQVHDRNIFRRVNL